MNFNVFRNTPIDPFISHMRIAYEDGIRSQTEGYWREIVIKECIDNLSKIPREDGDYCQMIHACEVEDMLYIMLRGRRHV